MKKFASTILSLMLLFVLFSGLSLASPNKGSQEFKVYSLSNAPEKGGEVNVEKLREVLMKVSSATIYPDMKMEGSVESNGVNRSFSLTGQLYRGSSGEVVYGKVTDQSNCFDVLRFEIIKNPQQLSTINKKYKKPILVLYLVEKGTRNLLMSEMPLDSLIPLAEQNEMFLNSSKYEVVPSEVALWMARFFKFDGLSEGESTPDFQISSIIDSTYFSHYTLSYNWFGSTATDTVSMRYTFTKPSHPSENVKAYTHISGNTIQHNGETFTTTSGSISNWKAENVEFKLETAAPEVITWMNIDAQGTQAGTVKVEFKYSYSVNGFSTGFSYQPAQEVDLNLSGQNVNQSRGALFRTKNGFGLTKVQSHFAAASWDIACSGTGTTCNGSSTAQNRVEISFDLYNTIALQSVGRKSYSHSFYVTQN
ncbi:hypothetical protein [Paenibacillus sp. MMS18-CY102]|uniref:hypothetical protein n=1 Tax=Paenibacillus sp. MMS18-CY102 TaxID=2682849 RepID=UPI0013653030|nr:hypothetical protein [Paenibacillus sp. MMS18-CY102]MWC29809.1 hypothetical protein [Paenibacillus sp. MMS18-CY102]